MSNENNFNIETFLNNVNLNDISKNIDHIQNYQYVPPVNPALMETARMNKQIEEVGMEIANKNKERELREKRNLEINEERLDLDRLKVFLLQSVNRDQKELLEKMESLIDITLVGNKIEEANLSIIQEEINNLKMSTDNLNESFINLIKSKMVEKGVEVSISYLLVGLKTLFFS